MNASCEIILRDDRGNMVTVKITAHENENAFRAADEAKKIAHEMLDKMRKEQTP